MIAKHILIILAAILCISCTNSSNNKTTNSNLTPKSMNNHQVIEEYNMSVNCPVMLQSSTESNPNFTIHLRGMDDDRRTNKGAFYEVYIIDWSYDFSQEQIEKRFHLEILPNILKDSQKGEMVIDGENTITFISSYESGENVGKVLGFIKHGVIYIFNVVGNDQVTKRFDSFISSISFNSIDDSREKEKDIEIINENVSDTSGLSQYNSMNYKFSLKYPSDWSIVEDYNQMLVLMVSDINSSKNYNVAIIRGVKRGLEDLVKGNIKDMRIGFPDAKVLSEQRLKVNGLESIKIEVEATNILETQLQYNSIYSFVKHNDMYIINFGCNFDEKQQYQATINRIISTFKISN